jgi:isoquinoline 1-oxidoreductase alpha subunit
MLFAADKLPSPTPLPDTTMARFRVNAEAIDYQGAPDTPLLWVLRDELSLTGSKFGCGMALCGACTVHLGNEAIRACVTPVSAVFGKDVWTIEDIGNTPLGKKVQQAWIDQDVVQCGYCQSGQVMSAVALLKKKPKPNDADIDEAMNGNICRCGTYNRVRAAIKQAAGVK